MNEVEKLLQFENWKQEGQQKGIYFLPVKHMSGLINWQPMGQIWPVGNIRLPQKRFLNFIFY